MAWRALAALSLLLCFGSSCCDDTQDYFLSDTVINNVVQDPQTSRIYVGAINNIYQLNYDLLKESSAATGPKKDNPHCTPPITAQCTDAKDMDNINKLLLVNSANGTLIVCGSLFRGICSLVNLNSVDKQVYYSDTKGEKTYVASTEESVAVVGVISYFIEAHNNANLSIFLVGKGYGSSDSSKLISTRLLQEHGEMDVFENMVEASTVQASPFVQRYLHDFRHAFKDNGYIYFLFSRTPGTSDSRKITFIARLCENDHHYYSYTELQLNCSVNTEQQDNMYNKIQAVYLARPGEVLFAVFSADEDGGRSALCMYPLSSINTRLEEVIESCYIGEVLEDEKPKTVYSPYISKTEAYKCGAEFLPSPLASKPEYALAVKPIYTRNDMLTAVAVAVENEHTVAFLGTSGADVLKVSPIPGSVPVQACEQKNDCQSCVSQRDPYCGWCVLEGRVSSPDILHCEFDGYKIHATMEGTQVICDLPTSENIPPTPETQGEGILFAFNLIITYCEAVLSLPPLFTKQTDVVCLAECLKIILICITHKFRKHSDQQQCFMKCLFLYKTKKLELFLCSFEAYFFKKNNEFSVRLNCFVFLPFFYSVVLYNCSVRREDCSLCKNADQKYNCVWCDTTKSCIYRALCNQELAQCPPPKITDIVPRYGPMKGQISVTIKGSNLGINIIALIDESPLEYLPNKRSESGPVEVEVEGGRTGQSDVYFTYRDPVPKAVSPSKGPAAGGTVITITGDNLDTASIDDISITVDREPLTFGKEITCMTGPHKGQKIPSDRLPVIVKYGKDTFKEVSGFEYSANPKVTDYAPRASFSKAMTAKEAQAFVGDVLCPVTILEDDKLFLVAPSSPPKSTSRRHRRDTSSEAMERKSQQAEREYEKIKNQLANLEESVRDRCKKEFTDLMIEMEDHTSDLNEARIPFLDYKNYTNRVFFLPSKDGANDVMITGKLDIPESRRAIVDQALNQFSNLLNSKTFLINFIRTLEGRHEFNARNKVYFASLLTVALHGKLEYYTDIMRTLLLELMEEYIHSKNPKLMLRRSETVVERMLCNWMSICLYQFLKDSAGEPLYKLFKAIKHQVEKGPVDAEMKKAKYTLNDTGLLVDDVEYSVLTLQVLVHGEGPDVTPVKVLNCDSISQVKEKIIEQVYRNLPYSQRPTVDSVALEWRPGSTGQILSDLDLTSQKEGRWKRINTLAHYNVRDGATLVLSRVLHTQQSFDQNQDNHEERNALLEDDKVFHLVRPADELEEVKSKRGSMKDKATTKAITEIYLTRLLSMKGTLQQFVDDFFRSVLCSGNVVPPAVKYFFDFLDEQAEKHDNVDDETIHIWKTNSLPLRFWVNILKNPHFIFDVHVTEVVDASLSVIAQTFMDACTKTEHKLTRESPSNKLLYAKEISTYKKMVDDYYKGIRQMVPVSDQDMNTHLAEVSRSHTDKLNTQVALHQLYQYASKYYDGIISSLEDDPAAQSKQLTLRLQQIAAALENKVTDL
uniref:Plexin B2 n=1 Tax=Sinocyclocheilus grahami TaxID=75366 RepID=A0A672SPE3_SINGR